MDHHHPRTKTRVITCLRNRADNVCDHHHKQSEIVHLKTIFKANGNPTSLINKTLQKRKPNQTTTNRDTNRNTNQERPKELYLPYVKHTSELIQSTCRRTGVSVVFGSHGFPMQNPDESQECQTGASLPRIASVLTLMRPRRICKSA